jgi:protease PrsW
VSTLSTPAPPAPSAPTSPPPAASVPPSMGARRWGSHTGLIQPRMPAFWLFAALVGAGLLYFLLEQLLWLSISTSGWLVSWVLISLYIVPVVLVVLWLDLYEPEPPSLMLGAFAWGALVAIPFSGVNNGIWGVVVTQLAGAEFASYWSPALTAPLVEEVYKYLGVAVIFLIARHELDDLMDGFVYGALIGLGFAVVEDVGYFMTAFGGDMGGVVVGFLVRTVASGLYGHVLFTGLAGIGFAYFVTHRLDRSLGRRLLVAAGLLALAIGAHFFWNAPWLWPQDGHIVDFLVATTVKGLPFFICLFALLRLARAREHESLVEALHTEAPHEGLLADEIELLRDPGRRRAAVRRVSQAAGPAAGDLLRRLQREQIELAVASRRLHAADHAELARRRAACHALRVRLWQLPGVLEALGISAEAVDEARRMPAPDVFQVQARVAPAGGWAWATPSHDEPRRGALVPGLALQVLEQHGNWLLVRAENGWLGWTDSRYLYPTAQ